MHSEMHLPTLYNLYVNCTIIKIKYDKEFLEYKLPGDINYITMIENLLKH